jgi:hypothetical protein
MMVDLSFRHVDGIIIEQSGHVFQVFSRRIQVCMVGYIRSIESIGRIGGIRQLSSSKWKDILY